MFRVFDDDLDRLYSLPESQQHSSASYPAWDLQERIQNSDLIAMVEYKEQSKVITVQAQDEKEGGAAFTNYALQVDEVFKGEELAKQGSEITLRLIGGETKFAKTAPEDSFQFQKGRYLVFLNQAGPGYMDYTGGEYYLPLLSPTDSIRQLESGGQIHLELPEKSRMEKSVQESVYENDMAGWKNEIEKLDALNESQGKRRVSIFEQAESELKSGEITEQEYQQIEHKKTERSKIIE